MKRILPMLAALALLFGGVGQAKAGFVQNSTGISNPAETITFDEHVLASGTLITNQYSDLGVTFSPGLYYSPQLITANGISGNNIGNFTFPTEPAYINPVTISFNSVQSAAAFGMTDDGSTFEFDALLNGVVVDTATTTVSGGSYFGFQGENFDAIRVSLANNTSGPYYVMDNIQLSNMATAVPEPASLMLLGIGAVGLGGYGWRRRRQSA